jgi:hypothetical protein
MRPDLRERAAAETLCSMRQRARPSRCCGSGHGVTAAVNVSVSPGGYQRLVEPECGDSVDELLRYVDFDPDEMLNAYLRWPREQGVGGRCRQLSLRVEGRIARSYLSRQLTLRWQRFFAIVYSDE